MAEEFRVLRPFEYHCQLISKGKRADGRSLSETRLLKFELDAIRTADASSLVKIGNTSLVCGCTTQISNSKSASDELINIKVELPPICSSPTGYQTQTNAHILTRTLKNILDETDCLDRSSLYIHELDCYWSIDVEVVCLNYDGSLLDASLVAVLAALGSLKLKTKDIAGVPESEFKIRHVPICTTFALVGEHFICDPGLEEETVSQSLFSITADSSNLYHVSKAGGKAINYNKLSKCIEFAKQRANRVRDSLTIKTSKVTAMDIT